MAWLFKHFPLQDHDDYEKSPQEVTVFAISLNSIIRPVRVCISRRHEGWCLLNVSSLEEAGIKLSPIHEIEARAEAVRLMFETMNDGEIIVSAYDTTWVALVEDMEGRGGPQFPAAIERITQNQLEDGSWGETAIFSAHDRIINTLSCIVALKTWKIHPDKCERGPKFLKGNLLKLEDKNAEHMSIGFEVASPSLLEIARNHKIDIAYDSPAIQDIYARREINSAGF